MSHAQIHTVNQPDSDITAFFNSCDRLDLLSITVESFLETAKEKTRCVIMDDSANKEVFPILVERYGKFSDIICFPENRSQWYCMDFMTTYCYTPYIMYIEDDWRFLDSGYLQLSKQILKENRSIGIIDISDRRFEEYGTIGEEHDTFFYKKKFRLSKKHLYWLGWCGSPNLKRREDLVHLGRIETGYAEWQIDRKFHLMGLKSVWLKGRYVTHIGGQLSRMEGKRPDDTKTPCMHCVLNDVCKIPRIDWYQIEKEEFLKEESNESLSYLSPGKENEYRPLEQGLNKHTRKLCKTNAKRNPDIYGPR